MRTTKYLTKVSEASNSKRPIRWTVQQLTTIKSLAVGIDTPTLDMIKVLYPSMRGNKLLRMFTKVKELRREYATFVGNGVKVEGLRDSKGKGFIYLVVNDLFTGWVKAGMTVNIETRLRAYNNGDPLKRYFVLQYKEVPDRRKSETLLKYNLSQRANDISGEWFKLDQDLAIQLFKDI